MWIQSRGQSERQSSEDLIAIGFKNMIKGNEISHMLNGDKFRDKNLIIIVVH